jgi:hypothetical protein
MSGPATNPSALPLIQIAAESATLKGICGILLAEIALLDKSPNEKLGSLVASIQGIVHQTAAIAQTVGNADTKAMAQVASGVVEVVCSTAEVALQTHLANRKG